VLLKEKLVRAELAAAKLHIREVGANNHGPWVKQFLNEVGLPEGYAWCDAMQSYFEHQAAGRRLPIESAGVAETYNTAKNLGWLVTTPTRGDLGCVNWNRPRPPLRRPHHPRRRRSVAARLLETPDRRGEHVERPRGFAGRR